MPKINHQRGYRENLGHRRCSCSMCGNPRRSGWGDPLTRQEQKALLDDETFPVHSKKGKKPYAIRQRSVSFAGEPSNWWVRIHRYRTRRSRDLALNRLRISVRHYPDGRPRYEFFAEGPG